MIMTRHEEAYRSEEHRDHLTRLPQLADAVIQTNIEREIEKLKCAPAWQQAAGRSSETLVKYEGLRIVLVVMKAQSRMDQHHADGPISIQGIQGQVRVHLPEGNSLELGPGDILALEAGFKHDVEALVESAFLLTISWMRSEPAEGT
jgi:quercetin dioxygenase-like cupin family protein